LLLEALVLIIYSSPKQLFSRDNTHTRWLDKMVLAKMVRTNGSNF